MEIREIKSNFGGKGKKDILIKRTSEISVIKNNNDNNKKYSNSIIPKESFEGLKNFDYEKNAEKFLNKKKFRDEINENKKRELLTFNNDLNFKQNLDEKKNEKKIKISFDKKKEEILKLEKFDNLVNEKKIKENDKSLLNEENKKEEEIQKKEFFELNLNEKKISPEKIELKNCIKTNQSINLQINELNIKEEMNSNSKNYFVNKFLSEKDACKLKDIQNSELKDSKQIRNISQFLKLEEIGEGTYGRVCKYY